MDSNESAARLNELLNANEDFSCRSYRPLIEKALSANDQPESIIHALNLIKHICTLFLRQDDEGYYSLHPSVETNAGSGFAPHHLSDKDEITLFQMLDYVNLFSLKARIGDVLWLRKGQKKYQAALIAVSSYLKAIDVLDKESHDLCPSLARALAISAELGTGGRDLASSAVSKCTNFLLSLPSTNVTGMHSKLLKTLSHFDLPDKEKITSKCASFAEFALQHNHTMLYRGLLQTQLSLCADNQDMQNDIKSKISESFVREADNTNSAISECHFLNKAIESYTRYGMRPQAQALYSRLKEAQKNCADEMHTLHTEPIDVFDLVQKAESYVADKPLMEALLRLAFIAPVFDINKMIPEAAKEAAERVLLQIVTPTLLDESGQPPFMAKGITNWTEDEATNFQLYENLCFKIRWFVGTTLLPAIRKVAAEHDVSAAALYNLMTHHPFVPEGFEGYYARGIAAGFKSDFSAASLFLVPQFENSLRYIIGKNGGQTFSIDPDKGQRARNIDSVINDEIIAKVFDDAHLMILKHLLIDSRFGGFRHSLAHGLLPYQALSSDFTVYLWWVIFRVLFIPYAPTIHPKGDTNTKSNKQES